MNDYLQADEIPVIAIDGPSASGKGTIAQLVAKKLGFHYLDSGALYRLVALKTAQSQADIEDKDLLADIARNLNVLFKNEVIYLDGKNVTDDIRTEECGILASQLAAYPQIREALTERQRKFRQPPGLVTDGRDMGSVIFPNAILKIFLTASAEIRAQRRYKQLKEKGINANIIDLLQDIQKRDERDSNRSIAPLQQSTDAKLLDTTSLTISQAQDAVLCWYNEIFAKIRV
ncbi:(d)CMP kinase [Nitrosomonas sp. Nm166]|uniref:(d)CMP kinase n=1 Tax=Nitrosomonas sp. Nm166 TaxID=1881054 RepID=UPI0008E74247|nr:(d)CMP kinase [Nitrosomonas sp. Nm166]SFE93816.1 3-phosphoshikimate 1-carboxyvinyltransferase/cytidylate kinase [Nitrosomonas sp. Nm166]